MQPAKGDVTVLRVSLEQEVPQLRLFLSGLDDILTLKEKQNKGTEDEDFFTPDTTAPQHRLVTWG